MKNILTHILALLFTIPIFLPVNLFSQEKKQSTFIDTLDNHVDLSNYLLNLSGFLPIVSPITEPAVGYGAAVAGIFFIPKKKSDKRLFQMPDIVGVAGGLTENGTWFGGVGYAGFWNEDRVRYRGVFGYGDINLKYYGSGSLKNYSTEFTLSSYFFLQQAIFRIGNSKFLLGGRYQLGKSTVFTNAKENIPSRDIDLINSGIGVIAEYENFNNILSPTEGLRANLTYDQFLKFLGSDRDFSKFTLFSHYYLPLSNSWVSGFRFESQITVGDTPFYMLPFIYLRGIPVMRYQGEITALLETEQLVMLTNRWGIVGFGGVGKTYNYDNNQIVEGKSAWNLGTGFRYLIARMLGLKMGIDIARGPEDWGIYVVFGSSWLK
jgi:hypothetical protein